MAAPKSTTLFHFTKSLDVLKSILKTGFIPRFCLEDIKWIGLKDDFIAFPIVCFCDIPLSRITDHVKFYGQFGIGMKQDWAIDKGLNPVIYVSQKSHLAALFKKSTDTAIIAQTAELDGSHRDNMRSIIGYSKPLVGDMRLKGQSVSKTFFQESEWRYLATNKKMPLFLKNAAYNDKKKRLDANNLAKKHDTLSFTPENVKYLFVKDETDIPELVNFINSELNMFPQRDVQTLLTRIISQDTIKNDI
ncbi:MAG: abortive infection system antitoxin AbiGi family protein [Desulfobulbus sp.]|nr:abortive infection system antitoxin AbiGi family protein [Desulfobulbus sp.]